MFKINARKIRFHQSFTYYNTGVYPWPGPKGSIAASGAKTKTKSLIRSGLLIETAVTAGLDTKKRMGFSKLHLW